MRGRRAGRKQIKRDKITTPISVGWNGLQIVCVV